MHQQKTIPSWIVAAMVSVLGFAGIGTGSLAEGSNVASIKRTGPEWVADWTLLIYASADVSNRSLASEMARDVEEIREAVGGSSLVRVLVLRDLRGSAAQNGLPNSMRFELYRGEMFDPKTMLVFDEVDGAPRSVDHGELEMNHPQTLQDFLTYGVRRFPAHRYWVTVIGHGDGWDGIAMENCPGLGTSDRCRRPKPWGDSDGFRLDGLEAAFEVASEAAARTKAQVSAARMSGAEEVVIDGRSFTFPNPAGNGVNADGPSERGIDVAEFAACRMSHFEVAHALRNSVRYFIASPKTMPDPGPSYGALGALALRSDATTTEDLVRDSVLDYVRSYLEGVITRPPNYVTSKPSLISYIAMDLSRIDTLTKALVGFRNAVLARRPLGFTCLEAKTISEAARAHRVPISFAQRSNLCRDSEERSFVSGSVIVRGSTAMGADEFPELLCGSRSPLSGPQSYFRFRAYTDATYEVRVNADFDGAIAYMFPGGAEACSLQVIKDLCSQTTTGVLTRRQPKTMYIKLSPEEFYENQTWVTVVIDSTGDAGHYVLSVKEVSSHRSGVESAIKHATVDLQALFEVLAGPERFAEWAGSDPAIAGCTPTAFPDEIASLGLAEERDAARDVLDALARPYVQQPGDTPQCGIVPEFGGRYLEIVDADRPERSPVTAAARLYEHTSNPRAEALRTRPSSEISILFGDIYDLATWYREADTGIEFYKDLSFDRDVGWSSVFDACIDEIDACTTWRATQSADTETVSDPCSDLQFGTR